MSRDKFWMPTDRVWVNRHTRTVHFAPESEYGYTVCGICVPAPGSETERLAALRDRRGSLKPCGSCYPLGARS